MNWNITSHSKTRMSLWKPGLLLAGVMTMFIHPLLRNRSLASSLCQDLVRYWDRDSIDPVTTPTLLIYLHIPTGYQLHMETLLLIRLSIRFKMQWEFLRLICPHISMTIAYCLDRRDWWLYFKWVCPLIGLWEGNKCMLDIINISTMSNLNK